MNHPRLQYSYRMIDDVLFIAVDGGVVIVDTQSPLITRFIANSFYSDKYPTPQYDALVAAHPGVEEKLVAAIEESHRNH